MLNTKRSLAAVAALSLTSTFLVSMAAFASSPKPSPSASPKPSVSPSASPHASPHTSPTPKPTKSPK